MVTAQPSTSDKVVVESVVDTERTFDDESEWPLERFCAELFIDLFEYVLLVTAHHLSVSTNDYRVQYAVGSQTRCCYWSAQCVEATRQFSR